MFLPVALGLILTAAEPAALPSVPPGWKIEIVAEAPRILYPTAIVAAPDGTVYLGQDPMDMPGPPTSPIDSIVDDQGRQDLGLRRQALERDGPGVARRHALRGPSAVPLGLEGHRRRRQGRLAGRPDDGPRAEAAGLQRHQRPRPLGRPPGDGRIPVHLIRRQGHPARRGQGRDHDPGGRRRRDPHPPRRHRAGGRLDRRAQPALGSLERDRRDFHLRQRRRQQEVAQQPDASHRRRSLRLSLPVPDIRRAAACRSWPDS